MIPQREIFWHIHPVWLFYLLSVVSLLIFFYGLLRHTLLWRKGINGRGINVPLLIKGFKDVVIDGVLAKRILRGDINAGIMHLFLFWGFFGLFLGTILLAFDHYLFTFLKGDVYIIFSFFLEVSGLILMLGLILALIRRYVQRIKRLENRKEDLFILLWLLLVVLTGFFLEGVRLVCQNPQWKQWSFLGFITSIIFSKQTAFYIYPILWWFHAILALCLVSAIPFTKLFHVIGAPVSIYARSKLLPIVPLEEREKTKNIFYAIDLVQLDACTRCGRCVEICPSNAVGEPFSPRDILFALQEQLFYGTSEEWNSKLIWYCTTCAACLEICPIYVAPFRIIRQLRSQEIEDGTKVPSLMIQALEKLYKYNNPWISSKKKRSEWARDMDIIDITKAKDKGLLCYFVGCTTAHDTRAQEIARSFNQILKNCGIEFGILGKKEPCCGDIARRVGEDGLFEEQAESCLGLFDRYKIGKIVTSSPHCFHTIKNEYPALKAHMDMNISVLHYSIFLEELLKNGILKFDKELKLKVTYHDPCYLGRHNGVFDSPRNIIRAIPGIKLIEMEHNRKDSLCCGGGGGRMWQEELDVDTKMSERRIEEAYETGADVVITCCPLCLIMLEDARKSKGLEDLIKVMDLNELILMAISGGKSWT